MIMHERNFFRLFLDNNGNIYIYIQRNTLLYMYQNYKIQYKIK